MTKILLFKWLRYIGRLLLFLAMDKHLRAALFDAVQRAEQTGLKGEGKMLGALEHVRSMGGKAVQHETDSSLRTLLEHGIDHLKL